MTLINDTINIKRYGLNYRIEGHSGQRIPVDIFFDEEFFPAEACAERLIEIASHPNVRGKIVALPDIFCKNKNFIPGGVAIAVKDRLVPMFAGANNDAVAVYQSGIAAADLNDEVFERLFAGIQQNITVYRGREKLATRDFLVEQMTMLQKDFIEYWSGRLGDLSLFEGGCGREDQVLNLRELEDCFPQERSESIPQFIPYHDFENAGCHSFGVIDGNSHFIEIDRVEEVYEPAIFSHFGLDTEELLITIHVGAGDLGIAANKQFVGRDGSSEAFEFDSEAGIRYRNSNIAAERFGYANRFRVVEGVKRSLEYATGISTRVKLISDAPHDMVEPIEYRGETLQLHRKGAVRAMPGKAFGEGHPYSVYGKPFLFPSYPGGDSFLMINTEGNEESFYTCSHGAGRNYSMEDARDKFDESELLDFAESKNVKIFSFGKGFLSSQAPSAFKPIDRVMDTLTRMNLARPIARVRPAALIKT